MLLHRGEADGIQPAEIADGALTVESPRDDVAPCGIAEREKQPIGLFLALQSIYNHLVVGYTSRRRCQSEQRERCSPGRLSLEAWRTSVNDATHNHGQRRGFWGRLASVDAGDERDRLAARPLSQQRSRLFDQQAEAYDRFRPTYPDAVIDELLGPVPAGLDVLDVGCGTGIASRQIAQRGAKVLGVELAPRMAEIARGHGVDVEIAAFEAWDAAGRTFDRVTSAQAWHWLDLPIATAKAASLTASDIVG